MKRKIIFTLSVVFLTCISGYAALYINEVNSTGKWIEIYNSGDDMVDVNGYTIIRNNNDGAVGESTIQEVALIPSKGFLVLYQGGAVAPPIYGAIGCLTHGISSDKFMNAILKDDRGVVVNTFDIGNPQTVTVSGGKSWARATDGAASIVALDPTPGESNTSSPSFSDLKIYINEVNSTGKWIEIYNDEAYTVNIERYTVTRYNNDGAAGIAAIPLGTRIESKGFLVLYQSGEGSPVNGAIECLPYGISTDKFMSATLRDDENRIVNTFSIGNPQTVPVSGGKSWARATDGATNIAALDPTPRMSNTASLLPSDLKIYINEVNSNGKWIEIYNDEAYTVNVEGYTVARYNNDDVAGIVTIPPGTRIASKKFLVLYQNGEESPVNGAIGCLSYGISTDKFMSVILRDDDYRIVDIFNIGDPQTVIVSGGRSWAREPDGAAKIAALAPTPGLRNDGLTNLISGEPDNVLAYIHAGTLMLPEKTSCVQLYSVSGMLVLSRDVTTTSVDLTNLPKGFYLVKLTISGVSYTQKIVLY